MINGNGMSLSIVTGKCRLSNLSKVRQAVDVRLRRWAVVPHPSSAAFLLDFVIAQRFWAYFANTQKLVPIHHDPIVQGFST
jgi:hypothetical protein